MGILASVLVGKPENILIVSIAFFVAYLVPWVAAPANRRRFSSLLIASVAWGVYAAWEWLVQAKTPEANIRVDLLVIWPILTILTAWALYRVLRSQ
jgi:hypothetical protein